MSELSDPSESTPVVVSVTAEPEPMPTTPVRYYSLHDHGFTNGLLRLDPVPFGAFIENDERLNQAQVEADRARANVQAAESRRDAVRQARCQHQEGTLDAACALDQHTRATDDLRAAADRHRAQRAALDAEKHALRPPYSWVPALLFLLASIFFIGSDVAITRDVVRSAFDMPDGLESWCYAIGLACVAFAIKPAIDRIVEKPYATDPVAARRVNYWFLGVVGVFAIVTLAVLGAVRGDAKRLDQAETAAEIECQAAQTRVDNARYTASESEKTTAQADLTAATVKLNAVSEERNGNGWMAWGFVLSGVLFAVAGAVCLGIGFPAIAQFATRAVPAAQADRQSHHRAR